jgi:hypothetical protein
MILFTWENARSSNGPFTLTVIDPGENIRLEERSESTGNADNWYPPAGTCKVQQRKLISGNTI